MSIRAHIANVRTQKRQHIFNVRTQKRQDLAACIAACGARFTSRASAQAGCCVAEGRRRRRSAGSAAARN
jgi:hypothetical protein